MSVARYRSPPTITTVPRNTLAHVHHKDVDAILKDLRVCSRRLKSALDSFTDELRTLERLYYKCKNQHRAALFFKRVPEMRRYGRRLCELDVRERVDMLRASFVGLAHTNDHKALRGSWSYVPETPYVSFLAERLTACSTLVHKMRERLWHAYNHFTLAMQTGAFVQIIVLFAAMSSRMSVLSSELEEALELGVSACNRLLVIIDPNGFYATAVARQRLASELEPALAPEPSPRQQAHRDGVVSLEDMGEMVSRASEVELTDTSTPAIQDPDTKMEARVTPTPGRSTIGTDDSGRVHARDDGTAPTSKKTMKNVTQKPRPKKAKKKTDEIDAIFGL